MVTLPEVNGVVAAGVVFTDGSTSDVVSGKLVVSDGSGVVVSGELVSGGSGVVELKMASGEQVEL